MDKSTMHKKVIGLSVISLLSYNLSEDLYTKLIEELCNQLIAVSDDIKQALIDGDALTFVDSKPDYNQKEVFEVLFNEVNKKKLKELEQILDIDGDLNDLFSIFEKAFNQKPDASNTH
jgi:hypothetical protein